MDNGGPAFPLSRPYVTHSQYAGELEAQGMSLRDYFAARSPFSVANIIDMLLFNKKKNIQDTMTLEEIADELAKANFIYARAMLKAREEFKK